VAVVCPVCYEKTGTNKQKLVIETSCFISHCWVCNDKITKNIYKLIKKYAPDSFKEFLEVFAKDKTYSESFAEDELPKEESLKLPKGFTLLAEWFNKPKPNIMIQALNYLTKRGVTERDLWYFKFGITENDPDYEKRVIIPSHDSGGELNFFTSRAFAKIKGPKYFNPFFIREDIIFNEINIDWSKELTLVEGPFDLVKVNDNATCLLGSELSEKYALFQKIVENETPVVLVLDNDAKKKTYFLLKLFFERCVPVKVVKVPKHYKDIGELTKEEFKKLLLDAKLLSNFDIMRYRLSLVE
jgi:hypothetical protein